MNRLLQKILEIKQTAITIMWKLLHVILKIYNNTITKMRNLSHLILKLGQNAFMIMQRFFSNIFKIGINAIFLLTYTYSHIRYIYKNNMLLQEIHFIVINLMVFTVAAIVHIDIFGVSTFLNLKLNNTEELTLALLQIQASVSTIGIAIISLISGLLTQKYYGISATNYIMNVEPKFLKFKRLIVIELLYIIVNYFLYALRIFDFVVAVTISSILVCIWMTIRMCRVFELGNELKSTIYEYVKSAASNEKHIRKKIDSYKKTLNNMKCEVLLALISTNYEIINDCMEIIDTIVCDYTHLPRNFDNLNCDGLFSECAWLYCDMFESNDYKIVNRCLQSMNKLYLSATRNRLKCSIFETIVTQLYGYTSNFNLSSQIIINNLRELRLSMYGNITDNPDSWTDSISFLPTLYISLLKNRFYLQLPPSLKKTIWEDFVIKDTINKSDYCSMTDSRFLSEPRHIELNDLIKHVIEMDDVDLFEVIYPITKPEYRDIRLSSTALIYSRIQTGEISSDLSNRYNKILYRLGYDFSFYCTARKSEYLKKLCGLAIRNIKGKDYDGLTDLSIIFYINEKQIEFMFFYILYHLKRLDRNEIHEILDWFFHGEFENAFNRTYYAGNTNAFVTKYRLFCETVLGGWNMMDEIKYMDTVAYCDQYFSGLGFERS